MKAVLYKARLHFIMVTRDIPANSFAAGNPCRVIREITEADSMKYKPEVLADNHVISEEYQK